MEKPEETKNAADGSVESSDLFGKMYAGPCAYDTDGDGNCPHCFRRGGCESVGGPFARKGKYPPGTPDHLKGRFEPK